MNLVYANEKRLFVVLSIISIAVWVALVVGTLGIALVYLLFFFVFYLFAHSAFIAYLKGTGVRITPQQFPDLHARLERACERLEMPNVPDAYLINSDGLVNALATRFLGRSFLVLFSDAVDALEQRPGAIDFYIGHELGHLRRKHLQWGPVLVFGSVLPLIGAAYSRAREYTCDLHGLACCADPEDAQRAAAVLAAGTKRWARLDLEAYRGQLAGTGGFWMSFHELIGDYPWLVKRMERITAAGEARPAELPRRNPFAWILALFVPRLGTRPGSAASGLVLVAIVGILAAIAIPAYQGYMARAKVAAVLQEMAPLKDREFKYIVKNQAYPERLTDLGLDRFNTSEIDAVEVGRRGTLIVHLKGVFPALRAKTLEISPFIRDRKLYWDCTGGTLAKQYRPAACR